MDVNQVLGLGSFGDSVKELENAIHARGYLPRTQLDGFYNIQTEKAVREFQKANNLIEDGMAGPIVLGVLFPTDSNKESTMRLATNDKLRAAFIETAYKYLGHKEVKTNSSDFIDNWLGQVGVNFPAPWCMAYVQGVGKEACIKLGLKDLLRPNTGGVLKFYNETKSEKISSLYGKRGDILIMDYGGGKGHTGWVVDYSNGIYTCIEGNTNVKTGTREGDGVGVNKRKYNDRRIKGFIRISTTDQEKYK